MSGHSFLDLGAAFSRYNDEDKIQKFLHFFNRLVPYLPTLDTEMFIKTCSVQAFHEPITLRAADLGRPALNTF